MSAAAVISIRMKRIIRSLESLNALSPESAIPETDIQYHDRWYFERLVDYGAIIRIDGRCYLDKARAEQYLQEKPLRSFIFLAVAVIIVVIYTLHK